MLSYAGLIVQSGFRYSRTNPHLMALGKYPRHVLLLLFATVLPLRGQTREPAPAIRDSTRALVTIGSVAEDRLRLQQILGDTSTAGFLLRSASSQTPDLDVDSGEVRWSLIPPHVSMVWNSDIPFSLNDGALWAGRGLNTRIAGGMRMTRGRLSLILTPQLTYSANADFQTFPYPSPERSRFASPLHTSPESLDIPSRFGDEPFVALDPGQSTLSYDLGNVETGVSTENQWWGPALRNALVMSNNAPGFPHLFLRTDSPLETAIGGFEFRWVLGRLQESEYFDTIGANDFRSINAFAVAFRPKWERNLTVGVTRSVYSPSGRFGMLVHLLDGLKGVGQPNRRPASDPRRINSADQLFSVFGRWVAPESGFEAYAEWARNESPESVSDFLTAPNHSRAYTLGIQWAKEVRSRSMFRVQTEVTNLEQSPVVGQPRATSFYKSRPVRQGYTHRGQVIGASIGPGASSQWIAADYLESRWELGVFGGRIRWENDTYYAVYPFRNPAGHDVSVFGGVRGAYRFGTAQVEAQYTAGKRFNYLFQNTSPSFEDLQAVDIFNHTLRLVVTPSPGPY